MGEGKNSSATEGNSLIFDALLSEGVFALRVMMNNSPPSPAARPVTGSVQQYVMLKKLYGNATIVGTMITVLTAALGAKRLFDER